MKKKSLTGWIKRHRSTIDEVIRAEGVKGRINDEDREDWTLNNEYLYSMAERDKVDLSLE